MMRISPIYLIGPVRAKQIFGAHVRYSGHSLPQALHPLGTVLMSHVAPTISWIIPTSSQGKRGIRVQSGRFT